MDVKNITAAGGKRMKAVAVEIDGWAYWLKPADARIALDWERQRPAETRGGRLAFIRDKAARIDAPGFATPPPPAAPPGGRWDCGNGHLRAQAILAVIVANRVSCCTSMEFLSDVADHAGPDFCRDLVASLDLAQVPF